MNLLITFGFFYGFRAVIQANFKFRFPKVYFWPEPPIPSLLVPYGETSDFYFSGHCGFMTIILCEIYRLFFKVEGVDEKEKKLGKKLFYLYCFGLLYVASVLLIFHGHYSIGEWSIPFWNFFWNFFWFFLDIVIGIFYGYYVYWAVTTARSKSG